MFCSNCGKELNNQQVSFCPNCGTKLNAPIVDDTNKKNVQNMSFNLKTAMFVICAISGVCALFFCVLFAYESATGDHTNFMSEALGSYWFEDGGFIVVAILFIICVVTGVIGVCFKRK